MIINKVSLMVGGEAGAGITRSGFLFAKACLKGGLHVFGVNDYQSLIRGGHNFYVVRVDLDRVYAQTDSVDLLLALNKETVLRHAPELVSNGGIVFDGESVSLSRDELRRDDLKLYPVPLKRLAAEVGGTFITRNTVALGAAVALLTYDLELLRAVVEESFKPDVARLNVEAARAGYDYSKEQYRGSFGIRLEKHVEKAEPRMFLTGNEAVGFGAIRAGCRFFAAYPMTPATPLLHFLAPLDREYGMVVVHAESEIAAVNMVAGASYAGVRAMTATSGGGFCLMSEGLGMLGMTENPAVIMVAQRPGPSTGLPTYTGQGDLRFLIHASQGEFPRVVLAPGDVSECYWKTVEAFNLAEKYQIPVILITDKYLVESHGEAPLFCRSPVKIDRGLLQTADKYKGRDEYLRHSFTENGVSPRATPGTLGAIVRTSANEHDESGYTTDKPELTSMMADKRFKKLATLAEELESVETTRLYGGEAADATILGWGSTKGPIREALKLLEEEGVKANYLQIIYLHPFPASRVSEAIRQAGKTIVVENNVTSQLSSLIREHLLTEVDSKILKYDGRPFNPHELTRRVMEAI